MFKRIYTLLLTGSLLSIQATFAAPLKPTNIKKIIQKKDKVIVIVHENGKDREIILSKEALKEFSSTKESTTKKKTLSKKEQKKEQKKETEKLSKTSSSQDKKLKVKAIKKVVLKKTPKAPKKVTIGKKAKKAPETNTANKKAKKSEYKVVQGDTLFSIARKFKVSLSDLVKLNKFKGKTLIFPDDIIKIPGSSFLEKAKKEVAKNNKTVYKVKRGDTIYSIAKTYNMKVQTLKKLNNFKPHPKLMPGMELTVLGKPTIIKSRKKPKKHIVRRGETIWTITRKYNLTTQELRLLNPKIRTHSLKVGSILNISKEAAIKLAKIKKSRKYKIHKSRLSGVLARYQRRNSSGSSKNVVAYAKRFLGSRYVWGASRPGAFDCSGFTQYVMRHAKRRSIPRVSRRQAYYGRYITRRNLRAGDLIFFDTSRRRRGYVNHVGIYIGNGKFIHASSAKHRVVITSLNKPFYRQRFMWGRRVN